VSADASVRIDSDATMFKVRVTLDVDEDGKRVFERVWERDIPRHLL